MADTRISVADGTVGDFAAVLTAVRANGLDVAHIFYNGPQRFGGIFLASGDLETMERIAATCELTKEAPELTVRVWFDGQLRAVYRDGEARRYEAQTEEEHGAEVS